MTEFPNWFAVTAQENFEAQLMGLRGKENLRLCQIGTFTGDASLWLLKSLELGNGSLLDDVDTWRGSDEATHDEMDFSQVESVYDAKVSPFAKKVRKFKMTSRLFFEGYALTDYDFIYIDGDHTAQGVLEDAVDAHRHLKVGGILAFDDYTWHSGKGDLYDPAPAINTFGAIYQEFYEVLAVNAQVWLRKIK